MTDLLVAVPPISAGPSMPEALGGPAADGVSPGTHRNLRRLLPAVLGSSALTLLVGLRAQIIDGVRCLITLDAAALMTVGSCVVVLILSRASVNRLSHPETSLGRGFVLDQVSLAATNALPGGMVLGPAARYRVSRSFGHSAQQSALGTFAAGQAFSLGRWVLVLIVLGHEFAAGSVSTADSMLLLSAVGAIVIGLGFWTMLVAESTVSRRVAAMAQWLVDRLGLRWRSLRNRDVATIADSLRSSATWMARRRAVALIGIGAISTLASGAILIAVVSTVGPVSGDPGAWELMRVYLLARVATSFVPTPGALAALDAALIAGLLAAGVDARVATAAVLIYRATTFVLPILTGGLTYLGWRRWSSRIGISDQPPVPAAG